MSLVGGFNSILGLGRNATSRPLASTCSSSKTGATPVSQFTQTRGYPGGRLKILKRRKKTVLTIGKLTKTMSVVAASKMATAAQKADSVSSFFTSMIKPFSTLSLQPKEGQKVLTLVMCTDKGLCGSTNNNLTRSLIKEKDNLASNIIVIWGDKGCGAFERSVLNKNVLFSAHPSQRTTLDFIEVASVSERILQQDFDLLRIVFNRMLRPGVPIIDNLYVPTFKYFASDEARTALLPYELEATAGEELLRNYSEFLVSAALNYSYFQNHNVEVYNRQLSMDNASKNAKEIGKGLSLKINRERQAIITTELGEITSGAAAVDAMRG